MKELKQQLKQIIAGDITDTGKIRGILKEASQKVVRIRKASWRLDELTKKAAAAFITAWDYREMEAWEEFE